MMIFAVMMLMSTAAFAGVNFSFAKISEVKQVGNGFFAYTAEGEAVAISAYQYTQMKDADGYFILSVDGKKVIAAGDEFAVEKLTVDSVGLEEGKPKVFFTNGTAKVFQNDIWLKLLKGQTLRHAWLNTPTWEWSNYATVDKGMSVAYHTPLAPAKKAVAGAKAPVKVDSLPEVKAPVPGKKSEAKAFAQKSTLGNGGISFRITH